jgi:Family of unknown function (DUF5519)
MSPYQESFIHRCAGLDDAVIGEGAFGPGPAVWVGKREIAHFDNKLTVDVRLTKSVIRARRSELAADGRVKLRSNSSHWLEVGITSAADVDFALLLVRDAVTANLPTAPPGVPPTGVELQRRRRFH